MPAVRGHCSRAVARGEQPATSAVTMHEALPFGAPLRLGFGMVDPAEGPECSRLAFEADPLLMPAGADIEVVGI